MVFWLTQREKLDEINVPALIELLPDGVRFRNASYQVRYARAIIRLLPRLRDEFEINTPLRLAHFLAQGLFESRFLGATEESMLYTDPIRIAEVYYYKFSSPKEAEPYVRKERDLANFVYADRYGNGSPESGDGWRYRGSGFMQLTFRDNYKLIGSLIKKPLEANPELVRRNPTVAVLAGAAYFKHNRLLRHADDNDVRAVSRGVNRGNPFAEKPAHGEAARMDLTERVLALIEDPAAFMTGQRPNHPEAVGLRMGDKGEDVRELQLKLNRLGQAAYNTGHADGSYGPGTAAAVRAFQAAHDLKSDGVAGPNTLEAVDEALADRSEGPTPERTGASSRDMADRGVRQAEDGGQVSRTGTVVGAAGAGVIGHEVMDGLGEAAPTDSASLGDSTPSEASTPISEEPRDPIAPTHGAEESLAADQSSVAESAESEVDPTVLADEETLPADGNNPSADDQLSVGDGELDRAPGGQELASPPPVDDPAQTVYTSVFSRFEIDWLMVAVGVLLVLAAVFIVLRGRRISRDTEDGYRAGRIS